MRFLAFLLFLVLAYPNASSASTNGPTTSDPIHFINDLCERIVSVVNAPQHEPGGTAERFRQIIGRSFDVSHMARAVLGHRWGEMAEAERKEFEALLPHHLARVYASLFSPYSERPLVCSGGHQVSDSDGLIGIRIERSPEPPISVTFQVEGAAESWKVVDVVLSGYSLVRLKRAEFTSVIQWSGLDRLLTKLRQ